MGSATAPAARVALIDWGEGHVDAPAIDLVLPHKAAGLDDAPHDSTARARAAWEAGVCQDDAHAATRLAEVRGLSSGGVVITPNPAPL
jgi:aminoglycoside phosphotransferase (APT) family kinase protein